jgi:hypothetical protein
LIILGQPISNDHDLIKPVFENLDFDYPVIDEPDPILMDYRTHPTFEKILAINRMSDSDTGVITLENRPISISLSGLNAVSRSCRSIHLVSKESVRVKKGLWVMGYLTGCRGHPGASVFLSSICADIHHFDLALAGGRSTEATLSGRTTTTFLTIRIQIWIRLLFSAASCLILNKLIGWGT